MMIQVSVDLCCCVLSPQGVHLPGRAGVDTGTADELAPAAQIRFTAAGVSCVSQ